MSDSIIPAANISSSALQAERTRLDVVAQNIANMNTTRGPDGNVYRRKQVAFESCLQPSGASSVKVANITEDSSPLVQVRMPGHPHADENGMVTMPNVDVTHEMADMITATRSFEANLQVLKAGKQMFTQSLQLGINR